MPTGILLKDNGKFGFIQQDSGEEDMFVMPPSCVGFGGIMPPLLTRVEYEVVLDAKTQRPRAENVQPEGASEVALAAEMQSGTMLQNRGSFGFIKQDSGETDMFVMPPSCAAFGGELPPLGTRLRYSVVTDAKTMRPRAENVQPENDFEPSKGWSAPSKGWSAPSKGWSAGSKGWSAGKGAAAPMTPPLCPPRLQKAAPAAQMRKRSSVEPAQLTGTLVKDNGKFGFIQQDSGEEDMFVMPPSCGDFGGVFPALGTRVSYDIVVDARTARPRAENVGPEQEASHMVREHHGFRDAVKPRLNAHHHAPAPQGSRHAGTILKDNGKFGFIQQDSGEADMFVMPPSCVGFGGEMPLIGTRVTYDIVCDAKTGKPRAENVQPEEEEEEKVAFSVNQPGFHDGSDASFPAEVQMSGTGILSGTFLKDNGKFGFIKQDSGGEDMFVMPPSCVGFGGMLPPIGTRVEYEVVGDAKTNRPRAENVQPEGAAQSTLDECAGTLLKDNGKFGFIQQDSGEEDMFVMPPSCSGFGGLLPPIGTRVIYVVVTDAKTGRPRAEDVRPERSQMPLPASGYGPQRSARVGSETSPWSGGKAKGKSKGWPM